MLSTETLWRELPPWRPAHLDHKGSDNYGLNKVKPHKRQYERRKASGLCTSTGCAEKPRVGHTHCPKHLQEMSKRNKEQYKKRMREGLCIYCGERPQFWGVRCVIGRQRFTKHPLPYGARRALRLYREAEQKREREQIKVDTRHAARMLLASGDITGNEAEALRLYVGADDGKWHLYKEVGRRMKVSKEWVRKLLIPSKMKLARILGNNVPWQPLRTPKKRQSSTSQLKKIPPLAIHSHPPGRQATQSVR